MTSTDAVEMARDEEKDRVSFMELHGAAGEVGQNTLTETVFAAQRERRKEQSQAHDPYLAKARALTALPTLRSHRSARTSQATI
jgi:hypothetical protein